MINTKPMFNSTVVSGQRIWIMALTCCFVFTGCASDPTATDVASSTRKANIQLITPDGRLAVNEPPQQNKTNPIPLDPGIESKDYNSPNQAEYKSPDTAQTIPATAGNAKALEAASQPSSIPPTKPSTLPIKPAANPVEPEITPAPKAAPTGNTLPKASKPSDNAGPVVPGKTVPAPQGEILIGRRDGSDIKPKEPADPTRGIVVPSLHNSKALPKIEDIAGINEPTIDKNLRGVLSSLNGTWVQIGGGNRPDFAEGGYSHSQITFDKSGFMTIRRQFDSRGEVQLTRKVDFTLNSKDTVRLGESSKAKAIPFIKRPVRIDGNTQILPASEKLPCTIKVDISKAKLHIGNKVYRKANAP